MTIDQRKIALISWISELKDGTLISQVEGIRSDSFNELPKEIIELLEKSDAVTKSECVEHSDSRTILGRE